VNSGHVTPADYATILEEHASFWGERDLRPAHHPALVHELADTSVALREDGRLVGYLFGFVVPRQGASDRLGPLRSDAFSGVGYVHLIGVRDSHRRRGLATRLWGEFENLARARGATLLRAITTPANAMSIGFHRSMGMSAESVRDYAGPGHDRVVFTRRLQDAAAVRDLDHVLMAAPSGCEAEARRFYGDLLGLSEISRPPTLNRPGVWFEMGEQQLHIGAYADFRPATRAHPGLRTSSEELDATATRLAGAGVDVRWDERLTDRRRFYTDDPWGNRLELLAYVGA
jgi:GNAT superfamily N-acetyltransferase